MYSHNNIAWNPGSTHKPKRLWRWNWSWKGSFSGKGCKGQNARAGSKFSPVFEWGQTWIFMRMPKRKWFKNPNAIKFSVVNVSQLEVLASKWISEIDMEVLLENKIVRKKTLPVKLLGNGEINSKVNLKIDFASKSAVEKIEKAGWKVEILMQDA